MYASNVFSFVLPASTTYTTSSMVRLVSAMFVERMIFRQPAGGLRNTRRCSPIGMAECSGSNTHREELPSRGCPRASSSTCVRRGERGRTHLRHETTAQGGTEKGCN